MKLKKSDRRQSIEDEAMHWFVAQRVGSLKEAERSEFVAWLRASPNHLAEYLALADLSQDLGQALSTSITPVSELLDAAARTASGDDNVTALRPAVSMSRGTDAVQTPGNAPGIFRRWRKALAAAAAVLVVSIAAFQWWHFDRTNFATNHGEQRSWRLPDGSVAHLNSSSRIRIDFDAKQRSVFLAAGQAMFQVAKDPMHPFIVRTEGAAVRAVGTEFDVYRQSALDTLVSVIEGRVALVDAKVGDDEILKAQPVFLNAGQQADVSRGTTRMSNGRSDVIKAVAWLQNEVAFDHDTLATATHELNRYNDLQIIVSDDAAAGLQLSGTFNAYDADAFVHFLERQPSLQVVRRGKNVFITSVGRRQ